MGANLKHLAEFKTILENYSAAEGARAVLDGLSFVAILGPASVGKNTIINELRNTGRYFFIVSDTTRPPRVNDGVLEQNGEHYFFVSEEQMLSGLRQGRYLEAEIIHGQQVSGMSLRELEKAKASGKCAITDMDIGGAIHLHGVKPDARVVLLVPPSFSEWQRRLATRSAMPEDERLRRMQTAAKMLEYAMAHDYFQFVITKDVSQSVHAVDAIAAGGPSPHQKEGRALAAELLNELGKVIH